MKLAVERNAAVLPAEPIYSTGKPGGGLVLMTPAIDDTYWLWRVRLSEKQAVVAFPKFLTIGIGFQVEEDWNTNLPYMIDAEAIFEHIKDNKGDTTISDEDCIAAIRLLQETIKEAVK